MVDLFVNIQHIVKQNLVERIYTTVLTVNHIWVVCKMTKVTFECDDDILTKLEKQAKENDRSVSAEIRQRLKESLN